MNAKTKPKDEMQEGHLYTVKDGELVEIPTDPEETLRKVKITDEAITVAISVQKQMRKYLDGFKPDITTVCSALIMAQAKKEDATKVVSDYWLNMAQRAVSATSKS